MHETQTERIKSHLSSACRQFSWAVAIALLAIIGFLAWTTSVIRTSTESTLAELFSVQRQLDHLADLIEVQKQRIVVRIVSNNYPEDSHRKIMITLQGNGDYGLGEENTVEKAWESLMMKYWDRYQGMPSEISTFSLRELELAFFGKPGGGIHGTSDIIDLFSVNGWKFESRIDGGGHFDDSSEGETSLLLIFSREVSESVIGESSKLVPGGRYIRLYGLAQYIAVREQLGEYPKNMEIFKHISESDVARAWEYDLKDEVAQGVEAGGGPTTERELLYRLKEGKYIFIPNSTKH